MTDKEYPHFWYQCQRLDDLKEQHKELREKINKLIRKNGLTDALDYCRFRLEQSDLWAKDKKKPIQVRINHLAFGRDVVNECLQRNGY